MRNIPPNMDNPQRVILDKPAIIKQLGLFSDLTLSQTDLIAQLSEFYEYKKDAMIYSEGDPPDAFYYLISGRVRVFTKDKAGQAITLEYLHRGAYFGIISILTGEPHSVGTQIINDAVILKIQKEDFHKILKEIPQLAIHLSSTLSRRLKRKGLGQKAVFESTIISVYGIRPGIGRTLYAVNLAKALSRETGKGVIFLDMAHSGQEGVSKFLDIKEELSPLELMPVFFDEVKVKNNILRHESGINILRIPSKPEIEFNKTQIIPLLSYLTNIFDYCVVDLSYKIDETVLTVLSQSDLVHIITDNQKESTGFTNNFVKELETVLRSPREKIKVVVNELNGKLDGPDLLKYKIYATLVDMKLNDKEYCLATRRIAREIGGALVGLALGSGAAWGLSQIGVIKVLEREGIPIDIVAGSSAGALIGAFWAAGSSGTEMEKIAIENKKLFGNFGFKDMQFPINGLISDMKTMYFLNKYLGAKTFRDIKFPLKIVATSLEDRKEVLIDSGELVKAVRASISIPGVYSPVEYMNGHLIDGGISNPLPVSVLLKMGVRKIIAVNAIPSPQDIDRGLIIERDKLLKEEAEFKQKGAFEQLIFRLKKKVANFFKLNILNTITSSMEALEYSMAEANCRQADVIIHPDVAGWSWRDFLNSERLIPLGEEACLKALPQIKKMIEE